MTMWKLYRWIRKIWTMVVALAALSGIGPGALPAMPGVLAPPAVAPSPAPAPVVPVPTPAVKKVIGQCATGTDGKRWAATCVVDGQSYTLPGDWPTHAAALQAIRDFRAADA